MASHVLQWLLSTEAQGGREGGREGGRGRGGRLGGWVSERVLYWMVV